MPDKDSLFEPTTGGRADTGAKSATKTAKQPLTRAMPQGGSTFAKMNSGWQEKLHGFLSNEEDARACKAISDDACREVPGNFFRIFVSNTLTKVGDRLASPKSTIAWLLQSLGAPVFFTGLIVPLREAGSLLPQLFVAGFVRRLPIRKWVWVFGSLAQGLAVLGMAAVAFRLSGSTAGWSILALLAFFSLARGFCSVASKDVLGKTISKGQRGSLNGWMSSSSGFIVMAAGAGLILGGRGEADAAGSSPYGIYLIVAGILWMIASAVYSRVVEFDGETDGGLNAIREAIRQLSIIREDKVFRTFVLIRALAIGSGLSVPFIIAIAFRHLDGRALWLGVFTIVDGLAALVSGPFWGRMSDRSSRAVLRLALLMNGCILLLVVVSARFAQASQAFWIFPLLLFLVSLIHNGVRLGRKTYLVDLAEGNRRTSYVAVSNTVIGVILLAFGLTSGLLAVASVPAVLAMFSATAFTGFALAGRLPDVST
jgi:hypothetical protein